MSGGAETPGEAQGPERATGARPADTARPADAVRRALRAARERDRYAAGADEPDAPGASAAVTESASSEARTTRQAPARPGDVAREALRRAAESRTGGPQEPTPEREDAPGQVERASAGPGNPRAADGPAPDRSPGEAGRPAARPGDIAREALRAAREATVRARAEAEAARAEAEAARAEAVDSEDRDARRATAPPDRAPAPRTHDGLELPSQLTELEPSEKRPQPGRASTGAPVARDRAAAALGTTARKAVPADRPGPNSVPSEQTSAVAASPESPSPRPAASPPGGPSARPAPPSAVPDPDPDPDPVDAPDRPSLPGPDTGLPAAPRVPRTMAAPSRDGELRRTFRPFPPRPTAGEAFAESWWGNAWVTALDEGALDPARLARGRTYADQGRVDAITVTPGLVLAYVHGSRARPYRVQLRLRTLDSDEWDRFLDAAAEQPAHIAALLDKELPPALAGPGPGPGAGRGTRLLPGAGELEPRCSCPDFGHPCKHAAALCYQTARLLDEDPFVLLLLRGRGERELLDALSRRNAARAARAAQEQGHEPAAFPGVRARDALAPRTLPPLPAPLPPPPHPEQPPVYPGAPGGPDPFALDQLATDAAARAHALLTTGRDPVAELTLWQDAVRLAAARPGSGLTAATRALYASLAAATGRTPADLARAVAAWRQGGPEGLTVLEEPWDPPAGRFDRARPSLRAADLPAFRPWRNHLTHPRGHLQLRLGRDGLWYAYESEPGRDDWWPRGTPDLDPVGALTGLGASDD
ncbi:SWIM zinc finger family protein [Streptomyces sp. VNUA24]|uniref:SWIM zinc finger family protein n=1 Tax=Streptomyces sp. VNUA24 TaxID=3031131 RepID=UPI0023B83C4A|nr:SWIM zinc finger family protein [Streptomyces sp. VNUA24]WEH14484.1 SWIM zinc finger family protein [Streptomyces sp. VNUA24]